MDQECPSLALLEKVSVTKEAFREEYRFLTTPRDCPDITHLILKGYLRHFGSQKEQIKNGGALEGSFKQFKDN